MMKRMRFVILLTLLGIFATMAWAQQGEEPAGALSWDSGYPTGNDSGQIKGSGTWTVQSGWHPTSGRFVAHLAGGPDQEDVILHEHGLGYFFNPFGPGTWSATYHGDYPPGTYSCRGEITLSGPNGATEVIMSDFGEATVGGQKQATKKGSIKITKSSGANSTISMEGTFQAFNPWQVELDSFRVSAIPTNFIGVVDKTRKRIDKGFLGAPETNTWKLNIPNAQPGYYRVEVKMTVSEVGNTNNKQTIMSYQRVSVTK